ncbi:MAG: DUF5940 domain-containing protein [Cloacibacillus evryensis]
MNAGKMTRAMIIGKGSLFLAALPTWRTAPRSSSRSRSPKQAEATVSKEEIRELILRASENLRQP